MGGVDGETQTFSAAPSTYANLQTANSGTGSTAATNCVIGGATKGFTAQTSINPGAFTNDAPASVNGGTAFTVLVHAAPPAGTSTNATRDARVRGQLSDNTTRDARIRGQLTSNRTTDVRIKGETSTNRTNDARIRGELSTSQTRDIRITGQLASNATRDARLTAQATSNALRETRITGYLTTNDTRAARITGQNTTTVDRGARITGETLTTEDTRAARIVGTSPVGPNGTTLIDDFERADENPLDTDDYVNFWWTTSGDWKLEDGRVTPVGTNGFNIARKQTGFTGNCEVFAQVFGISGETSYFNMALRREATNVAGYGLDTHSDYVRLDKFGPSGAVIAGPDMGYTFTDGD